MAADSRCDSRPHPRLAACDSPPLSCAGASSSATSASWPTSPSTAASTITATCPNTGAMVGLTAPGSSSGCRGAKPDAQIPAHLGDGRGRPGRRPDPRRHQSGIPTGSSPRPSPPAPIRTLAGYETPAPRGEVRRGEPHRHAARRRRKGRCYVEVKNVHLMREAGLAEFPDCVTTRGVKHLRELCAMVAQGHRAVMVYLIQRADADAPSPSPATSIPLTRRRSSWPRRQASRRWPTAAA